MRSKQSKQESSRELPKSYAAVAGGAVFEIASMPREQSEVSAAPLEKTCDFQSSSEEFRLLREQILWVKTQVRLLLDMRDGRDPEQGRSCGCQIKQRTPWLGCQR